LQLNSCGHNPYVISFLTRGCVCWLQLLRAFASGVIVNSESRGTHNHILLSQIRDSPPTWRVRSPYLYPPGTWWSIYNPRHWVPFSSPPTTRRATVEVFDPASKRDYIITLARRTIIYRAKNRYSSNIIVSVLSLIKCIPVIETLC
jgi:hypothetical protein